MGQFLAVGIATSFFVNKNEADKAELELTQLQKRIKQELYFPPEIYIKVPGTGAKFSNQIRTQTCT